MEQGRTKESPSPILEQNNQSHFVGSHFNCELSKIMHTLPQGCSNNHEMDFRSQPSNFELLDFSQSKHAEDATSLLSSIPFTISLENLLGNSTAVDTLDFNWTTHTYTDAMMHGPSDPLRLDGGNQGIPNPTNANCISYRPQGPTISTQKGEFLAQFGANEDLSAFYLNEVSCARDQHSFKENQVFEDDIVMMLTNDRFLPRARNNEVSFENLIGDSTTINTLHSTCETQVCSNIVIHESSSIPMSIPSPIMNATRVFNKGSGSSNFGSTSNMAIGNSYHAQDPTISTQKGELLAQPHGANEDLLELYLKGISRKRDHNWFEENQVPQTEKAMASIDDQFTHNATRNEVPFENLRDDSTLVNAFNSKWVATQSHTNYGTSNFVSSTSYNSQDSTISQRKRKMTWREYVAQNRKWTPISRNSQGQSSYVSLSSSGKFTLYDRRYEEMGFPMDPHLRLLNKSG